jgi:hypothetical protein
MLTLLLTTALATPPGAAVGTQVMQRHGLDCLARATRRLPGADSVFALCFDELVEVGFVPDVSVRPVPGPQMTPVAMLDVDGDGRPELLGNDSGGTFAVDPATGAVVADLTESGHILVLVADLDEDGVDDLVYGNGWTLLVRDLALSWAYAHIVGEFPVAALQLDGAPGLEIATTGRVLDPRTGSYLTSAVGQRIVAAADVDQDGLDEYLVQQLDGYELWNAGGRVWSWSGPSASTADFVDVDWDGVDEVLVPTDEGYAVLDGATGAEVDRFDQQPRDTRCRRPLLVGDFDGDGIDEAVCDDLTTWIDADASDIVDLEVLPKPDAVHIGDLDGDGDDELLLVTGGELLSLFDVESAQVVWTGRGLTGVRRDTVTLGDLDGDGRAEVVATDGGIHTYGWDGVRLRGELSAPSATTFLEPVVADFDGDGLGELASVRGVFDLQTGQFLHGSTGVPVDFDGDGAAEVFGDDGLVSDGATGQQITTLPLRQETAPLELPNRSVVLMSDRQGSVQVHQFLRTSQTFQRVGTLAVPHLDRSDIWPALRRIWYRSPSYDGVLGYAPADGSLVHLPEASPVGDLVEVDDRLVVLGPQLSVWAIP